MTKMNKTEETKKQAFNIANAKILPKEINGEFKGLAIIKIAKVGGKITWGIGRWNEAYKKVVVVNDFDKRMTEKILNIYPYQIEENVTMADLTLKKARLIEIGYNPKVIKSWTNKVCDNEFEAIEEAKGVLYHLTKQNIEDDTIENLDTAIAKIFSERKKNKKDSTKTDVEIKAELKEQKEKEILRQKEIEKMQTEKLAKLNANK